MKLSKEEKAAQKAAFRAMSPAKKLEHLFLYYKWPIILALIALLILSSVLKRELTKKDTALYLALINVAAGSEVDTALTEGYLEATGANPRRSEVFLYSDLYISKDADELNHEYAYASQMKVMAAIQAQKLDVVLMNRESYDIFSQNGYLAELPPYLEADNPSLREILEPLLVENEVILSDNSIEFMLGEADSEEQVTESVANALAVSSLPLFESAGFDGEVYLGIVANTPRREAAAAFLNYAADLL